MSVLQKIVDAVINGDEQAALQCVRSALAEKRPAKQILDDGLLAGMTEVGRRFREGEYFLPEVLIAAAAMKAGVDVLRPALSSQGVQPEARAVVGTVRGDLHDIGKNLVAVMLESAGFEVEDLGVDVSPETFIEACRRKPAQLVAMSALLTTTMSQMRKIVSQIRQSLTPAPRIIIGGAPVTQEYADEIGADGYGRDAATGADVARRLCVRR